MVNGSFTASFTINHAEAMCWLLHLVVAPMLVGTTKLD